jgi:hypothetical protein
MTDQPVQPEAPTTKAGRVLLEQEAYNSRSFPLITVEAIVAIEAEARAASQERPPIDVLAEALHAMGDACGPFTDDHPAAMHNSQAAAILARLAGGSVEGEAPSPVQSDD